MQEVGGLQEHVAELGERESLVHADLDGVLGQHVGHREVLPDVAQEVEQPGVPQPVQVVDHQRLRRARGEVEVVRELVVDRPDVGLDRGAVEQRALGRPAGRIPDHARAAADHRDRLAAEALQPDQAEDRDQVADVERVERRVEAVVRAQRPARREPRLQPVRGRVDQAAPAQIGQQAGQSASRSPRHASRRGQVEAGRTADRELMPPMLS